MIKDIQGYFDGGTFEIFLDNGESYSIDNRLFTKTKNKIYNGYPKDDNSNLIDNQDDIKNKLLDELDNYKSSQTSYIKEILINDNSNR